MQATTSSFHHTLTPVAHPFHKLPIEIIAMIFHWVTQLSERDKHTHILTVLQLVCQSWKNIVVETPQLWTIMVKEAPLGLAFVRSSNLPIDVEEYGYWNAGPKEEEVDGRMQIIRSGASRIQKLHLMSLSSVNLAQLLGGPSPQPTHFPLLRNMDLINIELSRAQWRQIIAACPGLLHIRLIAIQGEFAGRPDPMELVEFSDQIFTSGVLKYHQALHGGQVFGLQWAHIRKVNLAIDHAHHPITVFHEYATTWATVWCNHIHQTKGTIPLMTTTVEVYARRHSHLFPLTHHSSNVQILCEGHNLCFNITTEASESRGISSGVWCTLPTLTHPPPGTLHLVIHPGHRNKMHSLQPDQLLLNTKPNKVSIGNMVEGILNEDRGNWLRRLWALHLKDGGWPEVKEVEADAKGRNTGRWIKEQCDLAKADVEGGDEREWSGDPESEPESDA